MNITKVIKQNENAYLVYMQNNNTLTIYPIQEECYVCNFIQENKDKGIFEYVDYTPNVKKLAEFNKFLFQEKQIDKCEIRLFYNDIIVDAIIADIDEAQKILQNKINNGDTFEYELIGQNKMIINIPKIEAKRLHSEIENFKTKLGIYKRHYNDIILNAKTKEELDNIIFQEEIVIAGQQFVIKLLQLDFFMSEGMQIVGTFTTPQQEPIAEENIV